MVGYDNQGREGKISKTWRKRTKESISPPPVPDYKALEP